MKKICICYCDRDVPYVKEITKLLCYLHLQEQQLLYCSLCKDGGLPAQLQIEFQENDIWTLILLSKDSCSNTYSSEMKMIWNLQGRCTGFLCPGFSVKDLTGVLKAIVRVVELGSSVPFVLEEKLNLLMTNLSCELKLNFCNDRTWRDCRTTFINRIQEIADSRLTA